MDTSVEHLISRLLHLQQNHDVDKAELGSTSSGWRERSTVSSSMSVFTCIVVIKDDFEVGNYHDDHQGSGRHGDGILLLHCSFSLMTNDPHMVLHIVSQFI